MVSSAAIPRPPGPNDHRRRRAARPAASLVFTRVVVREVTGGGHGRADGDRDWPGRREGLTEREAEILALITEGRSNAEIAALVYLSENTVKSYVRRLYRKIGVASRTQAVLWGLGTGSFPTTLGSSADRDGP